MVHKAIKTFIIFPLLIINTVFLNFTAILYNLVTHNPTINPFFEIFDIDHSILFIQKSNSQLVNSILNVREIIHIKITAIHALYF